MFPPLKLVPDRPPKDKNMWSIDRGTNFIRLGNTTSLLFLVLTAHVDLSPKPLVIGGDRRWGEIEIMGACFKYRGLPQELIM